MFSCKQAARLLSESRDRRLSIGERLRLTFHLGICRFCRRFAADWTRFHAALRAYSRRLESDPAPDGISLPAEARLRILRALKGETE
jgi:hypothetical protein